MERKHQFFKKILESIFIIFCIISLNFVLIRFIPGDPVIHIVGEEEYQRLMSSQPEILELIRDEYGFNRSLGSQYISYLYKTIRGDFGSSYRTKIPVREAVFFRARWTLLLTVPAIMLSALLGGVLGLHCGWYSGRRLDRFLTPLMVLIGTIPSNCLAILFLLFFAFRLGLFPIGGIVSGSLTGFAKALDILWHMSLPLVILMLYRTASYTLLMKSTVQTMKHEEYITVARSKGFSERQVLYRHLLKNTLAPYITFVLMQFGHVLSGTMLVEVVFSWKGMGTLIYDAVKSKDFPVLQTCFLFIGITVVLCNLLADFINQRIDPRTQRGDLYE